MKIHRASIPRICCALIALVLFTLPCAAQEIVTGFEGGPSTGEGFITPIFSVPLGSMNAITIKPSANYLYYDERNRVAGETKITAPSASLGVGYRFTGNEVTFDIGPSLEVIWQKKKSTTAKLTKSQTIIGAGFAADLFYQMTNATSVNLSGSYDEPNRYYWSRGTLKQKITDLLFLGADVTYQGSTDVHQWSTGGLVELDFDQGATALQFRGGYGWRSFADGTNDQRPYAGLTLYHHF
jgi:hypothetical protein